MTSLPRCAVTASALFSPPSPRTAVTANRPWNSPPDRSSPWLAVKRPYVTLASTRCTRDMIIPAKDNLHVDRLRHAGPSSHKEMSAHAESTDTLSETGQTPRFTASTSSSPLWRPFFRPLSDGAPSRSEAMRDSASPHVRQRPRAAASAKVQPALSGTGPAGKGFLSETLQAACERLDSDSWSPHPDTWAVSVGRPH